MKKLLILGGTGDAVQLAAAAVQMDLIVISSLAGRTQQPQAIAGEVRIGGFGGVAGLVTYLRQEQIDVVIDATHPFAAQISENAVRAAEVVGIPRLLLARPGWEPVAGDRWLAVPDHGAAAGLLPGLGQRIFLTIGRQELGSYAHLQDLWFLMRSIEPPQVALPPGAVLLAQGPFTVAAELELLGRYRIEVVVSKNSGGAATYGKIAAARQLGLPVVMIDRFPLGRQSRSPLSAGEQVATVEAAVQWLQKFLSA